MGTLERVSSLWTDTRTCEARLGQDYLLFLIKLFYGLNFILLYLMIYIFI
jgi:hypothetical protein